MWTCARCSTDVEPEFIACWNCGTGRDGTPPPEDYVGPERIPCEGCGAVGLWALNADPILCPDCRPPEPEPEHPTASMSWVMTPWPGLSVHLDPLGAAALAVFGLVFHDALRILALFTALVGMQLVTWILSQSVGHPSWALYLNVLGPAPAPLDDPAFRRRGPSPVVPLLGGLLWCVGVGAWVLLSDERSARPAWAEVARVHLLVAAANLMPLYPFVGGRLLLGRLHTRPKLRRRWLHVSAFLADVPFLAGTVEKVLTRNLLGWELLAVLLAVGLANHVARDRLPPDPTTSS